VCAQEAIQVRIVDLAVRKHLPGVAVAVARRDGFVWQYGYGRANLEDDVPVSPDHSRFRIGSISKTLTAFALVNLADRGQLDLDVPIQTYVPAFPNTQPGVTLRRLAGHLAGIRGYKNQNELASTIDYPTVESSLAVFEHDPLVATPGEKFVYSAYGYTLISAAIESGAHTDFLSYMSESVFKPLGMLETVPDRPEKIIPGRTGFYYLDGGDLRNGPPINSSYKWAGAGFLSTATDLARFGIAHFDAKSLSSGGRTLLWTSQRTTSGELTGYGMGWFIGTNWVQHSGGTVGGSGLLRVYPQEQLVIVILANLSMLGEDVFGELPDDLHDCFAPASPRLVQ
jgi:serine beta-lactamase-like protein LACTB, mitochondrial